MIVGCPAGSPPPAVTSCTADADCGAGEVCTAGECVPDASGGCTSDADCATGETCTNGACVADTTGGCTSDADCATGETCTNGACVAETTGGCTSDADCASGEVCDNGACMTASGTPDAAAGESYYLGYRCYVCHGADAQGPPSLVGATAADFLARLSGTVSHPGGTFAVTQADADNLVAYVASIQ